MKRILVFLLVTFCFCASNSAFGQATQKAPVKQPAKSQSPKSQQTKSQPATTSQSAPLDAESVERLNFNYRTPGEMHQMLSQSIGAWAEEIVMWTAPESDSIKDNIICESNMILNGLFLETKHSGVLNSMPFEGISIMGYDNSRRVFVSTWLDNFGSGVTYMEGSWNEKQTAIVFTGKTTDPLTGKQKNVRQILKVVDDFTQTMEMYSELNGKEYKSMAITLTRR